MCAHNETEVICIWYGGDADGRRHQRLYSKKAYARTRMTKIGIRISNGLSRMNSAIFKLVNLYGRRKQQISSANEIYGHTRTCRSLYRKQFPCTYRQLKCCVVICCAIDAKQMMSTELSAWPNISFSSVSNIERRTLQKFVDQIMIKSTNHPRPDDPTCRDYDRISRRW